MTEQKPSLEKLLPCIVGSLGYDCIGVSVITICQVAALLQRQLVFMTASGIHGIALNTTRGVQQMGDALGAETWRGIFMQSDILIPPILAPKLAEYISWADRHKVNIVVPVKTLTMTETGEALVNVNEGLTEEQYAKMPTIFKAKTCGYGFYYGWLSTKYHYHEGDNAHGEDWNFFLDNKLDIYAVKLPFAHVKEVPLWINPACFETKIDKKK